MNDRPVLLSLLVGFIVVLVIIGVSLLVRMNALSSIKDETVKKNMELEKVLETVKTENATLKEKSGGLLDELARTKEENTKLKADMETLKIEMTKLEKLKDKLEENLKDELMNKEQEQPSGKK